MAVAMAYVCIVGLLPSLLPWDWDGWGCSGRRAETQRVGTELGANRVDRSQLRPNMHVTPHSISYVLLAWTLGNVYWKMTTVN